MTVLSLFLLKSVRAFRARPAHLPSRTFLAKKCVRQPAATPSKSVSCQNTDRQKVTVLIPESVGFSKAVCSVRTSFALLMHKQEYIVIRERRTDASKYGKIHQQWHPSEVVDEYCKLSCFSVIVWQVYYLKASRPVLPL